MSHLLGLATAVLVLVLGLHSLVRAPAERAGTRTPGASPLASASDEHDALASRLEGASADLEAPTLGATRVPYVDCLKDELAHGHWVEGRVVIPPNVPADERCFVVAEGRPFSDGSAHRVPLPLQGDGTFRVAFSPGAKAGWVALESRYLYLEHRGRWTLAKGLQTTELAPLLGGRVVGRALPPSGSRRASFGGEIHLRGRTGSGESGSTWSRTAPLLPDGQFVFEHAPSGSSLTLEVRGASWLGTSPRFALAPGTTEQVNLQLVRGVVLSGIARDESGARIAGATIHATGGDSVSSESDGSFRLPAIPAGAVTLSAWCKGYRPLERELGKLQAGTRRGNLVLALSFDER
jgi:hypothetical protein